MSSEQLQQWLREHADDISAFMDFEIAMSDESDLHETLELRWFRDRDWNPAGYRFVLLGQDGTGGRVALWPVAGRSWTPIVFFGSEGGSGVLAPSPSDFAQALAHAPWIEEYPDEELQEPARLSSEGNWILTSDEPDEAEEAAKALARYRVATEARFGPLPPFERLVDVPAAIQREFRDWVTSTQKRVQDREEDESLLPIERERRDRRAKAARYAAFSAERLPPNAASLPYGFSFEGQCASCGESATLRLTRFEDHLFGVCNRCYVAEVW